MDQSFRPTNVDLPSYDETGTAELEGFAITFAFATQEELQTWSKMRILRQTDGLAQKMAEMGSKRIRVNFAFRESE